MANTFLAVAVASIAACLITSLGIFMINKHASIGKKYIAYVMAFASGVLISVSFLHLVPESFEMNIHGPIYLLAGFLLLHIFGLIIGYSHDEPGKGKKRAFGIIPAIGIGFHSFIDGIIYSVTFSVSIYTGILAAIGMVLHEFPEGIITYLLLLKGGFRKNRAAWYSFIVAAISTPIGALVSYPFISRMHGAPLGALLALSSGALIYVGATHLLPEVKAEGKRYTLLALFAGIVVAIGIILVH